MPIKFFGTGSTAILWHGNETIPGEKTFQQTIIGDINSNGTSYFTSIGVGLTDPSAALHVNGKIFASDDIQAFYSSDRRFKDNIRVMENPLESLDKLNGYRFTWNEDLSHIHSYEGEDIGVIAQEVEEVLPEIVSNRTNGYKGVKYEKIVPLLIECIKELKSEIDILKSKSF